MDKLSMAIIAMEAHIACSNERLRQAWDIIHAKLVESNDSSYNTPITGETPQILPCDSCVSKEDSVAKGIKGCKSCFL